MMVKKIEPILTIPVGSRSCRKSFKTKMMAKKRGSKLKY